MSEIIELHEKLEKTCKDFGFEKITSITYHYGNNECYDIGIEKSHQPTVTKEEYASLVDSLGGEPFNLSADNATGLPQDFKHRDKTLLKIGVYFPSRAPERPFKITGFVISKDYEKRKQVLDHLVASLKIGECSQAKDDKSKK